MIRHLPNLFLFFLRILKNRPMEIVDFNAPTKEEHNLQSVFQQQQQQREILLFHRTRASFVCVVLASRLKITFISFATSESQIGANDCNFPMRMRESETRNDRTAFSSTVACTLSPFCHQMKKKKCQEISCLTFRESNHQNNLSLFRMEMKNYY